MKYICPCCGYKTLEEEPNHSYEICPVCYYEIDDNFMIEKEERVPGANKVTLKEAKENFIKYKACEERFSYCVREPLDEEIV